MIAILRSPIKRFQRISKQQKIAQKIGNREATIEIGIGDHFSIFDEDRDRDRNLILGDRAHALSVFELSLIATDFNRFI